MSALMKKKARDGEGSMPDDEDSNKRSLNSAHEDAKNESKKRMKTEENDESKENGSYTETSSAKATKVGEKAPKSVAADNPQKSGDAAKSKSENEAEIVALLMGVKDAVKPPDQAAADQSKPTSPVEVTDKKPSPTKKEKSEADQKSDHKHILDNEESAAAVEKPAATATAVAESTTFESGFMSFPEKIMMLLNKNLVKDAMWWLSDGDAFCILPAPFTEKVLDKHFQGTKFESFTRKLNRWGFKRVAGDGIPSNAIAFYHNMFHKDKPELLKEMSGGKTKNPAEQKKLMGKGKDASANLDPRKIQQQTGVASLQDNRGSIPTVAGLGGGALDELQQASNLGRVDPSPQLRALLAQQMGLDSQALQTSDATVGEQLLRARNLNHIPADLLASLSRQREMEQLLSLTQQRDPFLSNPLSADHTRLLLQQLGSTSQLGSADLTTRMLAQRAGALGHYGGSTDTALLLEQINASQANPDTDMALRLLLAKQRQGEPLNNDVTSALLRQQLGGTESLNYGSSDIQSRLLAERLRAVEARENSSDLLNRLLAQQSGGQSYESAELRARLMMAAAGNTRTQPLLGESALTDQQLYDLYLMEQQRELRSRLSGQGYGP